MSSDAGIPCAPQSPVSGTTEAWPRGHPPASTCPQAHDTWSPGRPRSSDEGCQWRPRLRPSGGHNQGWAEMTSDEPGGEPGEAGGAECQAGSLSSQLAP